GKAVVPLEVISRLMFPMWTYQPGEEDLTVMRIVTRGKRGGRSVRVCWDLLDFFHGPTGATSMSRTTALPCTATARLIASGRLRRPGVLAPEQIGSDAGVVEAILAELRAREIVYSRTEGEASPR
ncbi:MAG TPA: saccharopine dehydrogenase C-terminal domain-containing protein, partial [Phycisphaerales bacterium]|nr:saccharopine dehydrogenase C-terminal domain-containing protein [Phycisphaerales bacterium]